MVACRAEHLLADGRQVVADHGIRPRDLNLAVIPLGHSYGLGNLVMPLILQGTALVCAADYVPRQLVEWIGRYRITVFPARARPFFASWPRLPRGNEFFLGCERSSPPGRCSARPSRGLFTSVTGSKSTISTAPRKPAAFATTGPATPRFRAGRWASRWRAFPLRSRPGGWWYRARRWRRAAGAGGSTIAAEWNAQGELVLLGRLGDGANIGGKKVHPLEVERALRSLPGVTDAAVWLGQSGGRDFLAAAVETSLSRGEMERALGARLPAWKLPKKYRLARELPRNARGKLDLPALRRDIEESL